MGVQRAKPIDLSAGNEPFHINGGRGGRMNAGRPGVSAPRVGVRPAAGSPLRGFPQVAHAAFDYSRQTDACVSLGRR